MGEEVVALLAAVRLDLLPRLVVLNLVIVHGAEVLVPVGADMTRLVAVDLEEVLHGIDLRADAPLDGTLDVLLASIRAELHTTHDCNGVA